LLLTINIDWEINLNKKAVAKTTAIIVAIVVILIAAIGVVYYMSLPGPTPLPTPTPSPTPTIPKVEKFVIAYMDDNPKTSPWSIVNIEGLAEALFKLEDEYPEYDFSYIWSAPVSGSELVATVDLHVAQGAKMIIGAAYGQENEYMEIARKHPDIPIAVFEPSEDLLKGSGTVGGYKWQQWQAAYIKGIIAAGVTKTNKIGFVNAYDFDASRKAINAYVKGAKEMNPDVEVLYTTSGDFTDPTKGAMAASYLIAKGCDVIASYGDGQSEGVVREVAKYPGVPTFGEMKDMTQMAPDNVLMSSIAHMEVRWYDLIKRAINGTLKGYACEPTIADGIITFEFNEQLKDVIPPSVLAYAEEKIGQLETGEFQLVGDTSEYPIT